MIGFKALEKIGDVLVSPSSPTAWTPAIVDDAVTYVARAYIRPSDVNYDGVYAASYREALRYGHNIYAVAPGTGAVVVVGEVGWRAESAYIVDGPLADATAAAQVILREHAAGRPQLPTALDWALLVSGQLPPETEKAAQCLASAAAFDSQIMRLPGIAQKVPVDAVLAAIKHRRQRENNTSADNNVLTAALDYAALRPDKAVIVFSALHDLIRFADVAIMQRAIVVLAATAPEIAARIIENMLNDAHLMRSANSAIAAIERSCQDTVLALLHATIRKAARDWLGGASAWTLCINAPMRRRIEYAIQEANLFTHRAIALRCDRAMRSIVAAAAHDEVNADILINAAQHYTTASPAEEERRRRLIMKLLPHTGGNARAAFIMTRLAPCSALEIATFLIASAEAPQSRGRASYAPWATLDIVLQRDRTATVGLFMRGLRLAVRRRPKLVATIRDQFVKHWGEEAWQDAMKQHT